MKASILVLSLMSTLAVAAEQEVEHKVSLMAEQQFSVAPVLEYQVDETNQQLIFKPLSDALPKNCIITAEATKTSGQRVAIGASQMLCVDEDGKAMDSEIKAVINLAAESVLSCGDSCTVSEANEWVITVKEDAVLTVQWEKQ